MRLSPELALICDWLTTWAGLPSRRLPDSLRSRSVHPLRIRSLMEENQLVPLWMASGGHRHPQWPLELKEPPIEWRQAYYQSARQAALRQTVLQRVGCVLAGKAEVVVLKGMALTPALYPEAAARPMRDIDLLCASPSEKERVRDILIHAGFLMGPGDFIHHHLPPVFDPAGRVSIELHDNVMTPPLPADCMSDLWEHRQPCRNMTGLSELDPAAAWFHHALHAVSDPVDSPMLRDLFEVAWMANVLSAEQRHMAIQLAESSGRRVVVLGSGNLAADMFSGARWAELPVDAYTTWCRRRLEWTRPRTLGQRFVQHAGRERFNRLCERPTERNPLPWLWRCGRGVWKRCWKSWSGRSLWFRRKRLQRPAYPFVQVDGNVLIRNIDTRAVHMLNEQAAALWLAAELPVSRTELARVQDAGQSKPDRLLAIRRLIQNGLLVWVVE